MLKKTITYNDLDGKPVTETFYFALNMAEIAEMELEYATLTSEGETKGGFADMLKSVIATGQGKLIMSTFKDLLKRSYGRRSEDGRRFVKRDEFWQEFTETGAYSQFFMELVTQADAASDFIRGIVPSDLASMSDAKAQDKPSPERVAQIQERLAAPQGAMAPSKVYSQAELASMSPEDFQRYMNAR